MKRIYIFSATLFCALACHAQVKFGIFAGPNVSSADYSVKGTRQSTDYKFGFHFGAGSKITFENKLSFSPAISYKSMGYKVVFNTPSFPPDLLAKNNNTSFHEIVVDIPLQYDFSAKPGHFFVKAGPAFSCIISGREKFDLGTGEQVDRKMKFSVLNSYGRYDASAIVQLGFETKAGFVIYADYVQNFISMNNEDDGPSIRNRSFGFTLGKFLEDGKILHGTKTHH
jgi:hypothetical protein